MNGAPRRALRLAVVSWMIAVLGLYGAGTALAHDSLTGSNPATGSSVAQTPSVVTLTFSDAMQNLQPLMTVTSPNGDHWEGSPVSVVNNSVSVPVNPLGPAVPYTISYRIFSADCHAVEGTTTFTLTAAGTGTPNPVTAAGETASNSIPAWVWILGAAMVVLMVVIGGVISTKRRADTP